MNARDVRLLFRVMDWLLALPSGLEGLFWDDLALIQKEKQMPFITTPERVGERRGLREGIQALLKLRFGEEGLKLMPEMEEVHEAEQLREIIRALETAHTPEDLRRIWMPGA